MARRSLAGPPRARPTRPTRSAASWTRNTKETTPSSSVARRPKPPALFSGQRWSEVLWQNNEARLAITDWEGSNSATIYIARPSTGAVKPLESLIDMATIAAIVQPDERGGHCYWEAIRWERGGKLRFRVFGHTDTNPSHEFSYTFSANLSTRSVTVLRKYGHKDAPK